jgi:hypothetical protein
MRDWPCATLGRPDYSLGLKATHISALLARAHVSGPQKKEVAPYPFFCNLRAWMAFLMRAL